MILLQTMMLGFAAIAISTSCHGNQTKIVLDPTKDAGTCAPIPNSAYPRADIRISSHTDFARKHYPDRIDEFRSRPLMCHEIVMLGDSLTEKNDWAVALMGAASHVRNRGIAGDTSDGLYERLTEITMSRPKVVFILIGTNDLWSENSSKKIASNIVDIANKISKDSPATKVYVQTVLPIRTDVALNRKVYDINRIIRVKQGHNRFSIIDTYASFVSTNGILNEAYTVDGVHLNYTGYLRWANLLKQVLKSIPLARSD